MTSLQTNIYDTDIPFNRIVPVYSKYIYTTHFKTSNQFIAFKSFHFLIYIKSFCFTVYKYEFVLVTSQNVSQQTQK